MRRSAKMCPTVTITISAETQRRLLRSHLTNKLLTDNQICFSVQQQQKTETLRYDVSERIAPHKPRAVGARDRLRGSLLLSGPGCSHTATVPVKDQCKV